ncbi:diacylglycerol kinase family protein [Bacillaceae bacterium Marseille-Q3522]|nr:diacylglycerol kinase family protein [Bacillaceae bacterium Marseille-Q3522]
MRRSKFIYSFSYALQGIFHAVQKERNMKIHLLAAGIVIILGLILSLSPLEWLFIAVAIAGVFSLEMVNTALERVVDIVTEEFHPLAKQAKDLAAGAVLIYALLAVIIGLVVFLPKLIL